MKTLYKRASPLHAHTWKDIGGISGLVLDTAFFIFLLITSGLVLLIGCTIVVLTYLFHPLLDLLSICPASKRKFVDDTILLDNGTLATRPAAAPVTSKSFPCCRHKLD